MMLNQFAIYGKNMNLVPYLTNYDLNLMIEVNLKRKKVRLLEENTEDYIHDPEEGKHFLSRI